jgi:hypothetical protein
VTSAAYSLAAYDRLLRFALEREYRFTPFAATSDETGKSIYLRHDVDYALSAAIDLARVNAAHGVAGTFFLLLRGELYNLLNPHAVRQAEQLVALGQRIGLHYVIPDDAGKDLDHLANAVASDYRIFQANLPSVSPVVSWHNPTQDLMERTRDWEPRGFLNAYHRRFGVSIPYYSDSNFRNSSEALQRALANDHRALQLLCHPINWAAGGHSMLDVLCRAWPYVLRECEQGFLTNRVYRELFPKGMPSAPLDAFTSQWMRAARRAAR